MKISAGKFWWTIRHGSTVYETNGKEWTIDGPTGNPIELTHGTKRLSYLDIPGAGQVYVDLGNLAEADLVHNGAFGKMHHDGGHVGQ